MTRSDDPDQIRRDIERTQAHLTSDVDALTEKVTPSRIVARRVDRAKAAGRRLTDRVMGSDDTRSGYHYDPYGGQTGSPRHAVSDTASSAASSVSDAASSAASAVSDTASSAAAAVQEAPQALRRQTRGNPLAAGLIAFGVGWLVSSILPASDKEKELAARVKDQAQPALQPVAQKAQQALAEVKDNLQEPAQQAVESVRSTAQDAASTVQDHAKAKAADVKDDAVDAGQTVRQQSPAS
jgi:hypothetical protein